MIALFFLIAVNLIVVHCCGGGGTTVRDQQVNNILDIATATTTALQTADTDYATASQAIVDLAVTTPLAAELVALTTAINNFEAMRTRVKNIITADRSTMSNWAVALPLNLRRTWAPQIRSLQGNITADRALIDDQERALGQALADLRQEVARGVGVAVTATINNLRADMKAVADLTVQAMVVARANIGLWLADLAQ